MKKEPKLAPSRLAASSHQTKRRSDKAYWERVGRDKRRARRAGNRDKTNKAHNRQRYRLKERLSVEQMVLKKDLKTTMQMQKEWDVNTGKSEEVYPCRCGETHRGDYALYDFAHHNCFHAGELVVLDEIENGALYMVCGQCGQVFITQPKAKWNIEK